MAYGKSGQHAGYARDHNAVAVALELFGACLDTSEAIDLCAHCVLEMLGRERTARRSEARKSSESGSVYLLQIDGGDRLIKIGYTSRPHARFQILAGSTPYPLVLLALYAGTIFDEQALHKRFRAHRARNEWFLPAPEIISFAESIPNELRRETRYLRMLKQPSCD